MILGCPYLRQAVTSLPLVYRLVDFEPGPVQGPKPKLKEGPNQKSNEMSAKMVAPLFLPISLIVVPMATQFILLGKVALL